MCGGRVLKSVCESNRIKRREMLHQDIPVREISQSSEIKT